MRTDEQYQSSEDTGGEPTDSGLFGRISARVRRALGRVWGTLTSAADEAETGRDTDTNSTETTLPAAVDGSNGDDRHADAATHADREISLDDTPDTASDREPAPMRDDGTRSSSRTDERLRITGKTDTEYIESDVWEDLEG